MNVVLGERVAARLIDQRISPSRIRQIPNWANGAQIWPIEHVTNPLRASWNLSTKFVVGYSGNLGRAHEIDTLLGAISALETPSSSALTSPRQIVWLFIGGGALTGRLKAEVEHRGLKSVMFQPYQSRARLAESLSVADVHLVSLRPVLEGLIVPSKIYGVAAAGRPAIFIGDSDGEVARILARHYCGLTVPMNEFAALADAILDLARQPDRCRRLGRNARAVFEASFDLPKAVEAWEGLLGEVCAAGANAAELYRSALRAPLTKNVE